MGCTGLTSITISNSVTSIGYQAFSGCAGLTSVTISVTDLATFCNNKVVSLIHYSIGQPIKLVDADGKEIENLVIPNSVTSIESGAFWGCTELTSIEIPNSVTSIGGYAFSGCTGLKSFTVHNNRPPSATSVITSQDVYDNCILYIPKGSESIYYASTFWNAFKTIKTIDAIEKVPQDVNGDGIVDTQDVLEIYKYIQEH